MLTKTDRLIQQQIDRYFSRLSAVTKIDLLMRSPSVNMNEDGETAGEGTAAIKLKKKKKKTFASHFSFILIVFAYENN